jgi:TM2 domain-containing membrane protein YozV
VSGLARGRYGGTVAYGPYGDDPRQPSIPPMPAAWQQPASGPPMPTAMPPQYGGQVSGIPYPGMPQSAPPRPVGPQGVQPYGAPGPWGQGAGAAFDPLTGEPLSPKSKVVAGLLQIFLGGFGVGRFYTGHIGMAIAQICAVWGTLVLAFCFTFITFGFGFVVLFFVWIPCMWPLIDGIVLLAGRQRDSDGYLLRS